MNGVVYAAANAPREAEEIARARGWPLIAEPTSGLIGLPAGEALIGDDAFIEAHRPETVERFGALPTTRAALRFTEKAERTGPTVKCLPQKSVPQPGTVSQTGAQTEWLDTWERASRAARAALDGFLDAVDEPFEVRVARDVAAAVPSGSILVAGSSTPIRDLCLGMVPRADIRVLANRGASGIDGFVSTVFGVAWSGARTVALCGDLTLLHDAGSLLWSARCGLEATFVVVNNNGGGIFDLLPSASLPENDEFFVTPHGLDLARVAKAAGAHHVRTADVAGAIERARGVSIIEVPIERARALVLRAELRAAVREGLARAGFG